MRIYYRLLIFYCQNITPSLTSFPRHPIIFISNKKFYPLKEDTRNTDTFLFLLFMQISFLLIYKKYFLLAIPLHQQKIHEKAPKPIFFILSYFYKEINSFLLWNNCCHFFYPIIKETSSSLSHFFTPSLQSAEKTFYKG